MPEAGGNGNPQHLEGETNTTEAQIALDRLARGDRDEFWNIWNDHKSDLYAICLQQMNGSGEEAEDVLAEAMLKAFEKVPKHAGKIVNLKAWLARFVHNFCKDVHRARTRRLDSSSVVIDDEDGVEDSATTSPEQFALDGESENRMYRLIVRMPQRLREAFILRFVHDLSYADIADRLNLSPANVRKRIQRARAILKRQIGRDDPSAGPSGQSPADAHFPIDFGYSASAVEDLDGEEIGSSDTTVRTVGVVLPSGDVWETVGLIDHRLTRSRVRLETLNRYVQRHASGWKRRLALAEVWYKVGRWDEAVAEYRCVLQRHPRLTEAWLKLGGLLRTAGRLDEAAEVYEQALRYVRRSAVRHHVAGLIHACRGRFDQAAQELEQAASLDPEASVHHRALGLVHLDAEIPDKALASFDDDLRRNPEDIVALTYSHDALEMVGRPDEARRRVAKAFELDEENLPALKRLVDHRCRSRLIHGGEGKTTRRLLRRLMGLGPECADANDSLAFFCMCGGEWERGVEVLREFTEKHPKNVRGWFHYACRLREAGKGAQAVESILKACSAQADDPEFCKAACLILAEAGCREELKNVGDAALQRFPQRWSVWATVGHAFAGGLGDLEAARLASRRAVELQPGVAQAWFNHARILTASGRFNEAIIAFEGGWEHLPADEPGVFSVPTAVRVGELLSKLGDDQGGGFWRREADARIPDLTALDPALGNYWRGRLLAARGDAAGAARAYAEALDHHLFFPTRRGVVVALERLTAKAGHAVFS